MDTLPESAGEALVSSRTIFVAGSLNADLVQSVPRLPRPGETLRGGDLRTFAGGKGGNQAVAAARMGAAVEMIGQVGADGLGDFLLASLSEVGVHTARVARVEGSSGTAVIQVLPDGENSIVIAAAANATLTPESAVDRLGDLSAGSILLCQLEVPLETVGRSLQHAKQCGAFTILDPAPADPHCVRLLTSVHILTPNETEAQLLLGLEGGIETDGDAHQAAQALRALGADAVILKLGANGCYLDDGVSAQRFPAHRVDAVDTTAAGDTFNGALAAALAEDRPIADAIRFAQAAAAISVTRPGAQSSVPTRQEVKLLLANDY